MLSSYAALIWTWIPLAVAFAMFLATREVLSRKRGTMYPPGPRPLPLIGNMLDMPRKHAGRELLALTDKYGE